MNVECDFNKTTGGEIMKLGWSKNAKDWIDLLLRLNINKTWTFPFLGKKEQDRCMEKQKRIELETSIFQGGRS